MFKAEEVVEKGRIYHRKCFTCIKCNRPQDDKLQVRVLKLLVAVKQEIAPRQFFNNFSARMRQVVEKLPRQTHGHNYTLLVVGEIC